MPMDRYYYFQPDKDKPRDPYSNSTFVMVKVDQYGAMWVGDDMHMNGMDSPARVDARDIAAFAKWLTELIDTEKL